MMKTHSTRSGTVEATRAGKRARESFSLQPVRNAAPTAVGEPPPCSSEEAVATILKCNPPREISEDRDDSSLRRLVAVAGISFLLFATVGCETAREWTITGRLWNGEDARRFSDPAPHPNVQLSQWRRTGDILVQYDAITGRSEQIKRRAFLLEENRLRLENHQKLVFLDNVADADLTNIPRCNHGSFEASTNYPCYSMIDDERGFYLFRSDETPHEWRLPIYQESSGKWRNLAWTPIAVAGDCTILGLIAGALWVKWGGPGLAN